MTPEQVGAVLDAHDTLLAACMAGSLSLVEFMAAYGEFPRSYGLDSAGRVEAPLAASFRTRLEFHRRVSSLLTSVSASETGEFLEKAVLMRLRLLVAAQKTGAADSRW